MSARGREARAMPTILHLPADLLARLAYKYDVEGFPDGVVPNTEHAEVCMQVCKAWRDALAQPMRKWMRMRLIWSKQQVRLLQTLRLKELRAPFAALKANGGDAEMTDTINQQEASAIIAQLPRILGVIQETLKFIEKTNEKLMWGGLRLADQLVVDLLCELDTLERDFVEYRRYFLPEAQEAEEKVEITQMFQE